MATDDFDGHWVHREGADRAGTQIQNYAAQNSDHRFPYVLVISTLGTIISGGGVWLASVPIA